MSTSIQGLACVAVVAALSIAAEMAAAKVVAAPQRMTETSPEETIATTESALTPPGRGVRPRDRAPRRRGARPQRRTQQREKAQPPKYLCGCPHGPSVSDEVRAAQETIRVRVRLIVGPDGVPTRARMEKSHPLIPDAAVIECGLSQRFAPARLPDGTPIPYPFRRQFKFVAADELPETDDGE